MIWSTSGFVYAGQRLAAVDHLWCAVGLRNDLAGPRLIDVVRQVVRIARLSLVAAGQAHRQWQAVRVDDQVVLGTEAAALDRRRADMSPLSTARTCEASIAHWFRSS